MFRFDEWLNWIRRLQNYCILIDAKRYYYRTERLDEIRNENVTTTVACGRSAYQQTPNLTIDSRPCPSRESHIHQVTCRALYQDFHLNLGATSLFPCCPLEDPMIPRQVALWTRTVVKSRHLSTTPKWSKWKKSCVLEVASSNPAGLWFF